jgi:hypothetical protein
MCLVEESLTTVEASCSTLKVFRPIEKDGSGKIPILTGRGDFSANRTDSSRGEQVALGGHRPAATAEGRAAVRPGFAAASPSMA